MVLQKVSHCQVGVDLDLLVRVDVAVHLYHAFVRLIVAAKLVRGVIHEASVRLFVL